MLASRPPPPFTPSLAAMGKNSGGALGTGRNATELRIFLRRMKGRIITVEVQSNETVESVKKKIQIQGEEALPDRQPIPLPLFFAGKELKDGLSLADYSIHEHMLLVVLSDRASFVMKPPLMALARQYNKHTRRGYFYRPSKGSVPFKKTLHKNVGPDRHGAKKPENSKSPFQRQMTAIFSKKQVASCLLVSETHSVASIGYLPKNEGYLPKNEDYLPNPPAGPDRHGAKKPEKSKSPFQRQMTSIFSKKQAASCLLVSETDSIANIGYLPKRADVVHCKNEDYCEAYRPASDSRKRKFEDNLFSGHKKRAKITYASSCYISKPNVPKDDPLSQEQEHKLEQIFIKGFFGTISLQFNLEKSALELLNEVYRRIGIRASSHYLTCNHKVLENNQSLHEQGVSTNSHVYFNSRMRGGRRSLKGYLASKNGFILNTTLPDGNSHPELNDDGCLVLTSLVHRVTGVLSHGQSWAGKYSLDSFEVDDNHNVHIVEPATRRVNKKRIKKDLKRLAKIIKKAFRFTGVMIPYLADLIRLLKKEVPGHDYLDDEFKFIIDTHISLIPSKNRERIILQLRCLFESFSESERQKFSNGISKVTVDPNWLQSLKTNTVFKAVLKGKRGRAVSYTDTSQSAFKFIRNFVIHAPEICRKRGQNSQQLYVYNSGVEIMIFVQFGTFLASMLRTLHQNNKYKDRVHALLRYGLLRG